LQSGKWKSSGGCGFPEATVGIPNPESGCEFPEVLWKSRGGCGFPVSRGHKAQKASAAFFYVHKISTYANEQKARKQQPKATSTAHI
jgi:hypothetical protein